MHRTKNFVTTIVPNASKARVEIDEFISDNEMTILYLLALEDMQKEDITKTVAGKTEDWWTFYSLSGIHGQPAENWNGIQKPGGRPGSYCTHGELVFPTWHRVYVNMFEQAVSNKIQDIAAQFTSEPERSLYHTAANRFRLPFWDPLMPRNKTDKLDENIWGLPKILSAKHVWVKRPKATELVKIGNPLFAFTFPNQALKSKGRAQIPWTVNTKSSFGIPSQGSKYTIRSPGTDGETNISILELGIRRQAVSIGTNLWKLLARYTKDDAYNNKIRTWSSFATHNLIDPRTDKPILDSKGIPDYQEDTAVSLESWHDNIHSLVGTGQNAAGHMGNPAIAAFDPIFWLHHCNIDRILAIYQALYPDKWLRPENASTNLYPFHRNEKEFWTSEKVVRDWTTLGYAVPGNKLLDEAGQSELEKHLHDYYNWTTDKSGKPPANWPKDLSASIALNGDQAKPISTPVVRFQALEVSKLVTRTVSVQTPMAMEVKVIDQPKTVNVQEATANAAANPPGAAKDKTILTWNAQIRVKKFAYNGSFNIHIFIGPIPSDQVFRFITRKNEVGFSGIFATSADSPCANCIKQRSEGLIYKDVIPITHSLYAYLRSNNAPETEGPAMSLRTLPNFDPKYVAPFLKENLKWVLTDTASNLLDDRQMMVDSLLEIAVSARKFDLPTRGAPLGVYYPPITYRDITSDKVGGLGYVLSATTS